MRNPLARTVTLAVFALLLISVTLRYHVVETRRSAFRATTPSSKHSLPGSQRPLTDETEDASDKSDNSTAEASSTLDLSSSLPSPYTLDCDDDLDYLRELKEKYSLQDKFEYYKRYVKITRQDIPRKSLTQLDQNLMQHSFRLVDTAESHDNSTTAGKKKQKHVCDAPLAVPVTKSPFPATANLSDFMFGVSTTYKRFADPATSSVNEWSYWLTDQNGGSNGGKLVLFLMGATQDELEEAWRSLRRRGIDADVYYTDPSEEMAVRYLSLVPALYELVEERRANNKKWLVMCDDDTFFPSPNALAETFAAFNASKPMYVGTLSEDVNNVERHGSQAFGGAGVFISVPLAAQVARHFEACATDRKVREANTGWGSQGDILLRKCIYDHSDVRLTTLWDLWQLDLFGDPSGFYESGIRPLSLHHYRGGGWHIAHPRHYTKVSHLCGEDCMLQRFQTRDDFVLATSFSVISYPRGVDGIDMAQFERTFGAAPDDKGWNLDYMLGPQRKSLHKTGRKMSWDLQESTVLDDGSVSQVYVRKADDWRWVDGSGRKMSERDGVIELVWIS